MIRELTLAALLSPSLLLAGCGQSETASSPDESDDAFLAELLDAEPAGDRSSDDRRESESFGTASRREDRSEARSPSAATHTARGERLELRLQKGDRFPLIKTVEQSLVQKSELHPALAATRLELALAITVDDVRDDAILLAVRYSRVAYEQDVNGQRLKYDSETHQGSVPFDAIPYAGMVGNGFAFWLGRDNSIRELVGYQQFLERCVQEIPLERRQGMLAEISNRFGDDGVANFIDDSIGLLPFDASVDADSATRVLPGDVWTRERRLMQPVPIQMKSTYRLSSLGQHTAEIDITGRIASGEAINGSTDARLKITGGHSVGRCVVDRATGLPLDMSLTRSITLSLTTASNEHVVQEKQILTTIRAFPEFRGPVAEQSAAATIERASGTLSGHNTVTPIPTRPSSGSTVQAVYPN